MSVEAWSSVRCWHSMRNYCYLSDRTIGLRCRSLQRALSISGQFLCVDVRFMPLFIVCSRRIGSTSLFFSSRDAPTHKSLLALVLFRPVIACYLDVRLIIRPLQLKLCLCFFCLLLLLPVTSAIPQFYASISSSCGSISLCLLRSFSLPSTANHHHPSAPFACENQSK